MRSSSGSIAPIASAVREERHRKPRRVEGRAAAPPRRFAAATRSRECPPRIGPMQGDHPAAKAMPTRTEVQKCAGRAAGAPGRPSSGTGSGACPSSAGPGRPRARRRSGRSSVRCASSAPPTRWPLRPSSDEHHREAADEGERVQYRLHARRRAWLSALRSSRLAREQREISRHEREDARRTKETRPARKAMPTVTLRRLSAGNRYRRTSELRPVACSIGLPIRLMSTRSRSTWDR